MKSLSVVLFSLLMVSFSAFSESDGDDIVSPEVAENRMTEASTSGLKDCPECPSNLLDDSLANVNRAKVIKIKDNVINGTGDTVPLGDKKSSGEEPATK